MKVCIFGAGAVGGHLAVQLLAADPEGISIVARGPMLRAIRERGLALRSGVQETLVLPSRESAMEWVDVNGVSLRYELGGSGAETVVFVHGADTGEDDIRRLLRRGRFRPLHARPVAGTVRGTGPAVPQSNKITSSQ